MPLALLLAIDLPTASRAVLDSAFDVHAAITPAARRAVAAPVAAAIGAVLTNGMTGLSAAEIGMLPALRIICCLGAGYERVDLATARARGILVANAAGSNSECVADHALGLMLAIVRAIPLADRSLRAGSWRQHVDTRPALHGKRLGLLGFGHIGQAIACRAEAFGMPIAYHARHPRAGVPWPCLASPVDLAATSDVLAVALPDSPAAHHIVDAAALRALGPRGYLVNVGRGPSVDTVALVEALKTGGIAGAALDVFETEPQVPPDLWTLDNVVLTPHIAGRSPESAQASIRLVLDTLNGFFAGVTPHNIIS